MDRTSRWGPPARFRSLWRLRGFVRPYAAQMATMLACALLGVGAGIVIPLVIEAVVNGPIRHGHRAELFPLFGAALGLGLAEAGLIFLRRLVMTTAVLRVEQEIRDGLYAHLQRLPVAFHDRWQTGQLLSRATTDLGTIRRFLGFGVIFLIVNTVQYLVVIALLVGLYLPLGLLVAVTSLPVIWLGRSFGIGYSSVSRRVQDQQGDVATLVEEAASGVRVVKAFGRGPLLQDRFAVSTGQLRGSSLDSVRLRGRFWALLQLVPNLTMAMVVLLGGLAVAHNQMSLGALVAFTALFVLLQWPVIDLGWILAMGQEAATAADRIYEVLDTTGAVSDPPHPIALLHPRGQLAFEGVAFHYPGSDEPVLRAVNLELEPGETVAVVGVTGSGKSTLTALPIRLYDVTAGRITLDGHDVRDLGLSTLRRAVATAFEEPILFSMSVRENLVLGRPDATDAEIEAGLELAQADFAFDLPWGLETRIGEQGLSLSGGQRQRLALARAVISRPTVLVLDDPLSALDVHTESLVEAALGRVLRDTTGLLVVHRPSTVALADRVALLQDGVITATGSHSELMQIPAYAAILSVDPDAWRTAS
ncbi:MAG TPA: ABC transporter ATP-binding protein [Mycobacteriales bacterium]|nr:ABC transporter ATP-binding protein [Mycobacteriales bacterium]